MPACAGKSCRRSSQVMAISTRAMYAWPCPGGLACLQREVLQLRPPYPAGLAMLLLQGLRFALAPLLLRVIPLCPPLRSVIPKLSSVCIMYTADSRPELYHCIILVLLHAPAVRRVISLLYRAPLS